MTGRGQDSPQADKLDSQLGSAALAIGELMLAELRQGGSTDKEFVEVRRLPSTLSVVSLGGTGLAVAAARNLRKLRARASRCARRPTP